MKPTTIVIVAIIGLLGAPSVCAQESLSESEPGDSGWLKHTWSIEVGFGEIPFLSGSFKPSVSFGYYLNQYVYVGWIVQLRDILERGSESYNAQNTGLGHIESTREITGVRSFIGARVRPHRYAPYLAAGMLFNGSDREEMHFGNATRRIGAGTYEGTVTVVQTRPYAIRPALGLGYGVQLQNGFSISVEMTGAFFMRAPTPTIVIEHEADLLLQDKTHFASEMKKEFKGNFHNRYHMFNIGAGYVW